MVAAAHARCRGLLDHQHAALGDTSHRTVFPVFTAGGGFGMPEMEGGSEVLMLADPSSFRVLPWAPRTGWLLCDLYFADGRPVPFATRHVYRQALRRLADAGFDFMAGLEVEFHVFKLDDARLAPPDATWPGEAPRVSFISQGYAYLTETRFDQTEPILAAVRRDVVALGLPLRSVEIELGPSQCEFTFHPQIGLAPADTDDAVSQRRGLESAGKIIITRASAVPPRACPTCWPADGICTTRCATSAPAPTCSCRAGRGNCCHRSAAHTSAASSSMRAPQPVHHPDPQRLQAPWALGSRPIPRRLGPRRSRRSWCRALGGPGDAGRRGLENRVSEAAVLPISTWPRR